MESSWTTRVRHHAELRLVELIAAIVRRASMARVRRWGERLGGLAYAVAGSRRRIALDNVQRAMPELAPAEQERIVRGMFAHFGRVILELMRFSGLSHQEMLAATDIVGAEHVRRAYAHGKGVIFLSGHLGYWEIQGLINALSWRPISVMARPLDNPGLHDMLERIRTSTGNTVIYRQGAVRKVLRTLGGNGGVAILIDQHLQSPDAITVRFFGRLAATTSMIASLALRTGAAVIPAFGAPLPGGRYRFVYEPPLSPVVDDSPESIRDFTQRCNDAIERNVRATPDLWLWMHRRWRVSDVAGSSGSLSEADAPGAGAHVADGERHA